MNKKNWLLVLLAFVFTVTTFSSCKKSEDSTTKSNEWFAKAAFKGPQTSSAASFLINNVAYVTTGLANNAGGKAFRVKGTYAYDAASDTWTEKTSFAGIERNGAVGFSIGNIGYVGGGNDGTNNLTDFYKFDPTANGGKGAWSSIAPLPIALSNAVAFTLNGAAYVGTGETVVNGGTTNTNEFYKYDPTADTWQAISDAPFTAKRKGAFAFVVNNVAYIGGGVSNGGYPTDFYKFDGSKWSKLNELKRADNSYTYDLTRSNASAFVINGTPFVVGGYHNTAINSTWKYNISGDYWTNENGAFAGSARQDAIGFAVGNNGYITTGLNGSSRFDDTWMFTPIY